MINIVLLIVFVVVGAGLCVGYNFLVIRKYPEKRRIFGYILTSIVFLIVTAALFAVVSAKIIITKTVSEYSQNIEQGIKEKHSNLGFVKNGVDLNSSDPSKINNAVSEIRAVLPTYTELKLKKGLYDMIVNNLIKGMQKGLTSANSSGKLANAFADENNFMTVSSILNGLQKSIMKVVNIILLVVASIFILIFVIHIIKSLAIASAGKKAAQG